jgi:hypothetical protein
MKKACLIPLIFLALPWAALAQTTQPTIALTAATEDGKKMFDALVTLNGKPVAGVTVQFFVRRTFGNLKMGEDTTLDDGTCAIAFPSDLLGSSDGKLHLNVHVSTPAQYASVSSSADFPADAQPAIAADPFPRALWAPHAPLALLETIFVLVAGVWSCYAFVVYQIWSIRKGAGQ